MGHASGLHPPKVETFDLAGKVNIDPKGFERAVDEYRLEPFGLYMARPMPGRDRCSYLESWLLPELNLRITEWWRKPGFPLDYDFYIDIVDIELAADQWRTTDLYLDIKLASNTGLRVLDTDELLEATVAGLLSQDRAQAALEVTYRTVDGLAAHGYDLNRWLATKDSKVAWKRR